MKRTFLFLLALAFMGSNIIAQSVIYEDDFESYNTGEYLAVQAPEWTTWSNDPGSAEDALISEDYASSPVKSVLVDGSTDLVLPLGNKIAGLYELAFTMYVETGYGGYYNLQHFEAPGNQWAVEVYFGSDGTGEINADGSTIPFTYNNGAWIDVLNVVDLDSDLAEIWIDGALLHTWTFSTQAGGGPGEPQLGGLNVYAGAPAGDTPFFYFDDISYEQIFEPLYEDDFEAYSVGDFVAVEIPEWFTTWSNDPGSAEDAPIVDDQAYSGTQSFEVAGSTDLIFKLGDKTAGEFEVNWMMYVPSGFAGYYNFQHMEAPGNEWAVEVYFNTDGTGECLTDGGNVPFSFSHDTWMDIDHMINLDDDVADFYLDGVLIHSWVWSTQASGGAGTNQLGGVDFFAGAHTGETPMYYVDDVFYMQTGGATDPALELDPDMLDDEVAQGTTMDTDLSVGNIGGAPLDFEISIVYEVTDKKSPVIAPSNSIIYSKGDAEFEMVAMSKPGGDPPPTDDVTLNYDGPNDNSVGLLSPNEWEAAAKFPAAMVNQYAGMELYEVTVFINDPAPADDMAIKIYGMNQDYLPGDLLHEQSFDPLLIDWNTITLDTPIPITGEDIWVACYTNQTTSETHAIGTDAGPAVYNGDWIKNGPGWGHLAPGIDANWNIRATLQGDPIEGWLSVDPDDGTVAAGDAEMITVTYDASNLAIGTYNADLVFVTNAPESQFVELPVTLTVVDGTGIGEEGARIEMLVFPNPASSNVNVQSNSNISRLTIYNHLGQSVKEVRVNNTEANINVEGIDAGVYIIRMETENGYTTQKLVIE